MRILKILTGTAAAVPDEALQCLAHRLNHRCKEGAVVRFVIQDS
jgi:hypothetical protein